MDYFAYRDGALFAEDVNLKQLAEQYGTPCYVYSRATLERHWHAFDAPLQGHDHLICYAVKANSNIAILNLFARLGSGFDIVSVGELERVIAAGGEPSKVVFSGVGKRADEIRRALELGIHCFNVESEAELDLINQIAGDMGQQAPISLRVNPDVDARTHPYISTGLKENKFGIEFEQAATVYEKANAMANIVVRGIDCHIGSQLTEIRPFLDALDRVLVLIDELAAQGIHIEHLDIGGGLGIRYNEETPPEPAEYARALLERLGDRRLKLIMEPGRAIAGNAGILLTQVLFLKHQSAKNFAVIDAAMNDLIRPTLYSAWMDIMPLKPRQGAAQKYDLVGPICETGDFLGKDRELNIQQGDYLAVRSAGAYGFTMSSNYNTRPRAVEIMVDGDKVYVIRARETIAEQFASETLLPA